MIPVSWTVDLNSAVYLGVSRMGATRRKFIQEYRDEAVTLILGSGGAAAFEDLAHARGSGDGGQTAWVSSVALTHLTRAGARAAGPA
ncbi:hypothetical protein FMEAI12_4320038 [Parafrankia sp. Ea1.12]|nr:hypothetical protein FMEAI12_4320038 [Parafrankia sp. Ea1.12]